MHKIKIKPLSVNKCWQGKRFKTEDYKAYEIELMSRLPRLKIPDNDIEIELEFGMSKLSDIDNPLKPVLDILQKVYGFNDRNINTLFVRKKVVKKGQEYINFNII